MQGPKHVKELLDAVASHSILPSYIDNGKIPCMYNMTLPMTFLPSAAYIEIQLPISA
jgi:hypothetical protein